MIVNTATKIWHVSLRIEVLAHIEVDSDYSEDAVGMIARGAVSLFPTGQEDISLEIENVEITDIVVIKETEEQCWTRR